jgi:hypothetical protein
MRGSIVGYEDGQGIAGMRMDGEGKSSCPMEG